jgi:hypothetical protein
LRFRMDARNDPLRFEASLDGGPWTTVTSPKTYEGLADGDHNYQVRAIDSLGNVDPSPAVRRWKVETVAARVLSVKPTGKRVPPGANVFATFSEPMMSSTINGATFKLYKGGVAVRAAVTYDASAQTANLNPGANLKPGVRYKAVVSTEVKDLAGNALDQDPSVDGAQPKNWYFTVRR